MGDHRIVNMQTGVWECKKCGATFDMNAYLAVAPIPLDIGLAMMGAWNKMHKHEYVEECPEGCEKFRVHFEGYVDVIAEDSIEAEREVEREVERVDFIDELNITLTKKVENG